MRGHREEGEKKIEEGKYGWCEIGIFHSFLLSLYFFSLFLSLFLVHCLPLTPIFSSFYFILFLLLLLFFLPSFLLFNIKTIIISSSFAYTLLSPPSSSSSSSSSSCSLLLIHNPHIFPLLFPLLFPSSSRLL